MKFRMKFWWLRTALRYAEISLLTVLFVAVACMALQPGYISAWTNVLQVATVLLLTIVVAGFAVKKLGG